MKSRVLFVFCLILTALLIASTSSSFAGLGSLKDKVKKKVEKKTEEKADEKLTRLPTRPPATIRERRAKPAAVGKRPRVAAARA